MERTKQPHAKQLCGAKTRAGTPCKNYAMANGKCRMHGGKSTGAPRKNSNAEKHGLFSKYLPQETMDLVNDIEGLNTIDILWDNIKVQYAAIIRAQKTMYVETDKDDDIHTIQTGELGKKFQVITANEKQANFLQSQSRAMNTLSKMIRDYEDLCKSDVATEEQKLKVEKLKVDIDKVKAETKTEGKTTKITIVDEWIDADES